MALDKRKVSTFFDSEPARRRLETFIDNGDCYPLHVVLHLTDFCNHQCNFCSNPYNTHGSERQLHTLDAQDVIKYIKEFKELGVNNLVISGGGEPLLHKDIERVLEEVIYSRVPASLYTNLDINLSPKLIQQLSLLSVGINLNTLEPLLYKSTRGKNSNLERVKENIRLLQDLDTPPTALVIVKDDTARSLKSTVKSLLEMGLGGITVSSAFDLPYADKITATRKTLDAMERLKTQDLPGVRVLSPVEQSVKVDGRVVCKSHYFDITIGADYGVYPCCMTAYIREYQLFNLRDYLSFKDAWQSEARKRTIEEFQASCKNCWFAPLNKVLSEDE
ncbi:MAG: radical SAM protein [Nanoarchaeota archaeon]|nr:radical SAM protein [Nanoarchaeota archaeon]